MRFETVLWDDGNLVKMRRATPAEVEQVIANADRMVPSRDAPDRYLVRERTDGRKPLVVVVQLLDGGRTVRPITAWQEDR